MVDGNIARHGEKPSFEIAPGIVLPDFLGHADPGLLEKIFGFGRLTHQAQQILVQAILVAREKRRKRVQVSASKLGYFTFEPHSPLPIDGCAAYHIYYNDEV